MKRVLSSTLLVLLAATMLASCATPTVAPVPTVEPMTEKIVVTDALDRTVEFDEYPSRIVIVGKAAFMPLDAAFLFPEAQERISGYELRAQTGVDFIATVYPKSSVMTVLETDSGPEQIAPLNPDLVIMKSYLKEQLGDQVELLGIKVVYLDLETPEKINKDIQTLGQVFGNQERADELVALYDRAKNVVTDTTATIADEEKPSALLLQYSDKGGEVAFSVPPANYLQSQLIEMAGGISAWKDIPTDGWTIVTVEQIAAWNPDVIFIIDYKGKAVQVIESLRTDANWMPLDAVKNAQLYAFPLDFQSWDQPDTRWTLGLQWIAAKLHPELYADYDLVEETKAFYRDFYGLSDDVITEKVLPLLKGDL